MRHVERAMEVQNGMAMEACRGGAQDVPGEHISIKNDWGGGKVWIYSAKGQLSQCWPMSLSSLMFLS